MEGHGVVRRHVDIQNFLDNRLTDGGEALRPYALTAGPPFTPRKIPGTLVNLSMQRDLL
jgi:hypothetical protein